MHGMLPTLSYMKRWRPDLYTTDVCRMCELEVENTHHLWRCEMTMDKQLDGWAQEVKNVNKIGKRTWRKECKEHEEREERAKEKGREKSKRRGPTFKEAPVDNIWDSLEIMIGGVSAIRSAREFSDADDEDESEGAEDGYLWTVQDLYQGLTPMSMATKWARLFKTTKTISRYMAGRFVKAVEEFGRTEIWNKRCKVTVDWERELGITAVSKRAGRRNCVGDHRRSGSDFMGPTLRQGPALDVTEIRTDADKRVLQSYTKQAELNVMERLGGCKFLMTPDRG